MLLCMKLISRRWISKQESFGKWIPHSRLKLKVRRVDKSIEVSYNNTGFATQHFAIFSRTMIIYLKGVYNGSLIRAKQFFFWSNSRILQLTKWIFGCAFSLIYLHGLFTQLKNNFQSHLDHKCFCRLLLSLHWWCLGSA